MTRRNSSPVARMVEPGVVLAVWMAALLTPAALTLSQDGLDEEPAEATPEPAIELDAEALLQHPAVLPERIDTSTWQIEPNVGRRLVALPLKVTPVASEAELGTSPSMSIRGGRFLTWMIEPAEPDAEERSRRSGRDRQMAPADDGGNQLPEDAPLFARRLTVQPDGRVQWRLERSLPNAVLSDDDQQLYVLRIRPDRLRELQPERPGRVEAGGSQDRASMARQRREAQRAYLQERRAYGELRSEVMALPDEFEIEQPERIWAIFEIAETNRELSLGGDEPPLPWSIRMDDLEALRGLTAGRGGRDLEGPALDALQRTAAADHPLSNRLAAHAAVQAGVVDQIEPHDSLYNLLKTLLESEDEVARRTVLAALAETNRPNPGTLSLLQHASSQNDPTMKLIALRGLLQSDPRDSDRLTQMVSATSELLADREGPDPALVLGELIDAVSDAGEDVAVYVAANLSFDRLSAERLASAVRYVVATASEQPIAAGWLDRQLLGSANPNVVEQTLEVIAAADTGSPWAREAAKRGIAALFGPGTAEEGEETATLALEKRIPIHNASHALFRSLNSGHERLRSLAWQSLNNFEFAGADQRQQFRRTQRSADEEDTATVYDELVDAALNQSPTPTQAVRFLSRQPDGQRAARAMLQLMLQADEPAAAHAARAMVGSGWPIEEVLAGMSADDRAEAGRQLYQHLTEEVPLVTALLAHDGSGGRGRADVARWFGQRVAAGSLPMPGEWTEPFRNEDDLLALAGSSDSDLAAGAVAALVYAAGGDDIAVQEQVDRFAELAGAEQAELASAWASARQDIYARRLAASEGSYRFVALVHSRQERDWEREAMPQGEGEDASSEPAAQMTLGVVDLHAEGRSISLSNDIVPLTLAESELAIRIERVHALQGFRNDSLDELSLENVREPLDLSPQPDGSWVGSVVLGDGRRLEVRMEPVE